MIGFKVLREILFPPILLIVLVVFSTRFTFVDKIGILFYPISFGIILGLVNFKLIKFDVRPIILKVLLSICLTLIASMIVFVLGFLSLGIYGLFEEFMKKKIGEDQSKYIIIIISFCLIAPVVFFYLTKLIFKVKNSMFSFYTKLVAISFLIIYFHFFFNRDAGVNQEDLSKIFNPYLVWQPIIALATQSILHQEKLKVIFSK